MSTCGAHAVSGPVVTLQCLQRQAVPFYSLPRGEVLSEISYQGEIAGVEVDADHVLERERIRPMIRDDRVRAGLLYVLLNIVEAAEERMVELDLVVVHVEIGDGIVA